MRVLVTGGAGYIGAVLTSMLLDEGHLVTVVDNFQPIQTSLLACCHYPSLEIIKGDVRDRNLMRRALKQMDFIFLLAAIAGAPACDSDPTTARTINVHAIEMLLRLRHKNQNIIFPCTNSGYGIGQEGIYCTEETPMRPVSLYGRLKVQAEEMVLSQPNTVSLRLATVFGASPSMRFNLLVNDFVYRAVNDGHIVVFEPHFKRNYIHVRDVARAFIHCLNNFDKIKDEPYNVGLSDANLSKWELCQEIKRQVPDFYFMESPQGRDPDQRNYIVSNDKIEATGFKPQFTLQDGIAELIKVSRIMEVHY